jgi:hypothetical protein
MIEYIQSQIERVDQIQSQIECVDQIQCHIKQLSNQWSNTYKVKSNVSIKYKVKSNVWIKYKAKLNVWIKYIQFHIKQWSNTYKVKSNRLYYMTSQYVFQNKYFKALQRIYFSIWRTISDPHFSIFFHSAGSSTNCESRRPVTSSSQVVKSEFQYHGSQPFINFRALDGTWRKCFATPLSKNLN